MPAAGARVLRRIHYQFFLATQSHPRVQLAHFFGGEPLLIEVNAARQSSQIENRRRRRVAQHFNSRLHRRPPRYGLQHVLGVDALRLKPRRHLRILQVFHPAVRIRHLDPKYSSVTTRTGATGALAAAAFCARVLTGGSPSSATNMMGSMASSGTATSPPPLLGLVSIKLPPWSQGESRLGRFGPRNAADHIRARTRSQLPA